MEDIAEPRIRTAEEEEGLVDFVADIQTVVVPGILHSLHPSVPQLQIQWAFAMLMHSENSGRTLHNFRFVCYAT